MDSTNVHAPLQEGGPSTVPTHWRGLLLGAVAYYLAARLGMEAFALQPANITVLWLPSGIGLCLVFWAGWRAAPGVFLASFLANYPGMRLDEPLAHLAHTAVAASADTLAAVLAAALMRRLLPEGLRRVSDLLPFTLAVCALPNAVAGLVLTANLVLGGYITGDSAPGMLLTFAVADGLGMLLVFPLVEAWREREALTARQWLRCASLTALALLLATLAFAGVPGLLFLALPVLALQQLRGRSHTTFLSLLLLTCLTVALAARAAGPFVLADPQQARLALILFLFSTALVVLGLALQQRALQTEARSREAWEYQATHDFLTGLHNRKAFLTRVEDELARSRRTRRPFALALIDLDRFKEVNDSLGHQAGDEVLVRFATRLRGMLRDIDVAARVGGEEFAVLFPETAMADAALALDRIRAVMERQRTAIGDRLVSVTFTAGLVEHGVDEADTVDDLLRGADRNLYTGKRAGRNRVVADPTPQAEMF